MQHVQKVPAPNTRALMCILCRSPDAVQWQQVWPSFKRALESAFDAATNFEVPNFP